MMATATLGPAWHVETGPNHKLPCFCDIGHDHTFEEFFQALDQFVATEIAQAEASAARAVAEYASAIDAIPDDPEYPHPREDY